MSRRKRWPSTQPRAARNRGSLVAYDEQLANRIRRAFTPRQDVTARKMFGGLAFLFRGRMCCGIVARPDGANPRR